MQERKGKLWALPPFPILQAAGMSRWWITPVTFVGVCVSPSFSSFLNVDQAFRPNWTDCAKYEEGSRGKDGEGLRRHLRGSFDQLSAFLLDSPVFITFPALNYRPYSLPRACSDSEASVNNRPS